MRVGILRETIREKDARVALVPEDIAQLLQLYPTLEILIQPSETRIYKDSEYAKAGAVLKEDISDADLNFGIKEVDPETMISGKTYFFFAHVGKLQNYHKSYLKALINKQITLVDYEYLRNEDGHRLTAFGYWAGVVGVYNAIRAMGKKNGSFSLPHTETISGYAEMIDLLKATSVPPLRYMITGNGLTARGVSETLQMIGVKQLTLEQAQNEYSDKGYLQLQQHDYIKAKNGNAFDKTDYYQHPYRYFSVFEKFTSLFDVYFPCHYWAPEYPIYLPEEAYKAPGFKIQLIADISCDLNGPIASSMRETTLVDPYYDYHRKKGTILPPFTSFDHTTVMTVGNLPAALPREASNSFSKALCQYVFPELIGNTDGEIIENATLIKEGKITSHFSYLYPFLNDQL